MSKQRVELALMRLEHKLKLASPVAIAVSGGVDSMTLAYIAHTLVSEVSVFHALSPAVPKSATQRVKKYASKENWNLHLINANEMNDPEYLRNPVNRCYFCKSNLYQKIKEKTTLNIASGTNIDDLDDYRPGLTAASENNVFHPYVEASIDKRMVRNLAKYFGLSDLQELPASPCLSSRITTGIRIDPLLLTLIDKTEIAVRTLLREKKPVNAVRCRILKGNITIQLDADENFHNSIVYAANIREVVKNIFQNQGFESLLASINIEPYKKGSAFIQ